MTGSTHLILLAAPDVRGLIQAVDSLQDQLAAAPHLDLGDFERRYWRSRKESQRLALIGSSVEDLRQKSIQARELLASPHARRRMPPGVFLGTGERVGRVAFLFPGQGSQYPGMLGELSAMFPCVQGWCDQLDHAYRKINRAAPSAVLREASSSRLYDMPTGAQLGLIASMAVAELLNSIGILPDCLLGHSNGERAALLVAGALGGKDPATACAEFAKVSLLAESLPNRKHQEGLLAVICKKREVIEEVLAESNAKLFLAISNAPSQFVLGGEITALEHAAAKLKTSAAMVSHLPFERAFHTPLVADWSDLLLRHLADVPFHRLWLPVYSTLTTQTFPEDPDTVRDWMARQWSSTVRFQETIEQMYADGVRLFVEVGPDAKLTALVQDSLRGLPHRALSASSSTRGEWAQFLHLCAELHVAGLTPDPGLLYQPASASMQAAGAGSAIVSALRQEHQLTRLRIADAERRVLDRLGIGSGAQIRSDSPGCGRIVRRTASETVFAEHLAGSVRHPYLRDHAMGSEIRGGQRLQVVPFTYSLGMAAEAARRGNTTGAYEIRNVQAHRWLALDQGSLDLEIRVSADHARIFAIKDGEPQLAFEAEVSALPALPDERSTVTTQGWREPVCRPESFYRDHLFHGPAYHCIRSVRFATTHFEAEIEATAAAASGWTLDPALLDCAGQLVAYWMLENGWKDFGVFPIALESIALHAGPPQPGTRVRVYGKLVVGAFGITSANFDFILPGGRLLWRIRNFKQKILNFPAGLGRFLFGKDDLLWTNEAGTETEWRQFVETGQGIWARVLAHSLLPQTELSALYREPAGQRIRRMADAISSLRSAGSATTS